MSDIDKLIEQDLLVVESETYDGFPELVLRAVDDLAKIRAENEQLKSYIEELKDNCAIDDLEVMRNNLEAMNLRLENDKLRKENERLTNEIVMADETIASYSSKYGELT